MLSLQINDNNCQYQQAALLDSNLLRNYVELTYPTLNDKDTKLVVNNVFMAALRGNVSIQKLLYDIENEQSFRFEEYYNANRGNIYDFVQPEYVSIANEIANCKAGSNGGMANIGNGEWIIPFLAPHRVKILKNGKGDLHYNVENKNDEWKWNGGKIDVSGVGGTQISKQFNELCIDKGIILDDKGWVPFRKKDEKKITEEVLNILNGVHWEAISGKYDGHLTGEEYKKKLLKLASDRVFEKSDILSIYEEDGRFIKFNNPEAVVNYYEKHIEKIRFEIRAKQLNKVAMYMCIYD